MTSLLYVVFILALLLMTFICGYLVGVISTTPRESRSKNTSRKKKSTKLNVDAPAESSSFEGFRSLNRGMVPPEVE